MIKEATHIALKEAKESRAALSKSKPVLVGRIESAPASAYLHNFAACILNRHIDIYDDAVFLLENKRYQAACMVSRSMIETYAFAQHFYGKLRKLLSAESSASIKSDVFDLILKFTNSSKYKVGEQVKLNKGVFSLDDYSFTPQAIERMSMGLSGSEHVMNALRELYNAEKVQLSSVESQIEQTYDVLSEWVHPSQTSLFHHYVEETHEIPTSYGNVNFFDNAIFQCAAAIHFITGAGNHYEWAMELADEMDRRIGDS
ncbi:hypothetical protein [Stenotrophomonas rhizophila]|uniref:hypothetical protein n=1 Tax=Stenotrophomonas rhizophila TaxID=216778 RepID=UPI001639E786|nr:hypothetical protein [Stenotrophomonas rhizophila]